VVQSEIRRLNLLVDQFLDFARPRRPRFQRQRLEEVLEETVLLVGPEASKKKIRVERSWQETPPVWADGDQLKQVFLNIFLNSIESLPEGGRISLDVKDGVGEDGSVKESSEVVVIIADTGPGIAAEDLPRVFDPFFTTKEGGTGLGLSIAHRIIIQHDGDISVEGEEGKGSIFTISLPLES